MFKNCEVPLDSLPDKEQLNQLEARLPFVLNIKTNTILNHKLIKVFTPEPLKKATEYLFATFRFGKLKKIRPALVRIAQEAYLTRLIETTP